MCYLLFITAATAGLFHSRFFVGCWLEIGRVSGTRRLTVAKRRSR